MTNKKCIGCGTVLQSVTKNKLGYINPKIFEKSKYCERCFKIIHYNEKLIIPLKGINEYIIGEVNKKNNYVFFLIDLLNINEETIKLFNLLKGEKTLVISKLDTIPKNIKQNLICHWLREEYGVKDNIIFISSKKKINTRLIYSILEKKHLQEAYFLGITNAGKSTLINQLCVENNITNNIITTSLIPNTTLDFIRIKLNDNLTIIDSPGFTFDSNLYNDSEIDLIERINPKSFLKPITYQTKDVTSLIIENKIRIIPGNKNSLTFYMSDKINITRRFADNKALLDKERTVYNISDNSDVVIRGVGFINVKKACILTVYSEYKNLIEIRKSMF